MSITLYQPDMLNGPLSYRWCSCALFFYIWGTKPAKNKKLTYNFEINEDSSSGSEENEWIVESDDEKVHVCYTCTCTCTCTCMFSFV